MVLRLEAFVKEIRLMFKFRENISWFLALSTLLTSRQRCWWAFDLVWGGDINDLTSVLVDWATSKLPVTIGRLSLLAPLNIKPFCRFLFLICLVRLLPSFEDCFRDSKDSCIAPYWMIWRWGWRLSLLELWMLLKEETLWPSFILRLFGCWYSFADWSVGLVFYKAFEKLYWWLIY